MTWRRAATAGILIAWPVAALFWAGLATLLTCGFDACSDSGIGLVSVRTLPIFFPGIAWLGALGWLAIKRSARPTLFVALGGGSFVIAAVALPALGFANGRVDAQQCPPGYLSSGPSFTTFAGMPGWQTCPDGGLVYGRVPGTRSDAIVFFSHGRISTTPLGLSYYFPPEFVYKDEPTLLAAEVSYETYWRPADVTTTTIHGVAALQLDQRERWTCADRRDLHVQCAYRHLFWLESNEIWEGWIAATRTDDPATIAKIRDFLSGPVLASLTAAPRREPVAIPAVVPPLPAACTSPGHTVDVSAAFWLIDCPGQNPKQLGDTLAPALRADGWSECIYGHNATWVKHDAAILVSDSGFHSRSGRKDTDTEWVGVTVIAAVNLPSTQSGCRR